jgi:hypothetical protein
MRWTSCSSDDVIEPSSALKLTAVVYQHPVGVTAGDGIGSGGAKGNR